MYNIPVLLLIGWRGEPGVKDEPQHIKQGKVTLPLLDAMGIKYAVLSQNEADFAEQLKFAKTYMDSTKEPFAFIVQKDTFEDYKLQRQTNYVFSLDRESAIQIVASSLDSNAVVVSTTGMISRELFEYRERVNRGHESDFLTVGSMGHASQIALGIALHKKEKRVYCFDGDGATLMHMGSLAVIGSLCPTNYVHVVFNNGAHDSVGGQPTVGLQINLPLVAEACGYRKTFSVSKSDMLQQVLNQIRETQGPVFLEIKVKKGSRKDLGRPTTTPIQNKEALMNFLSKELE